CVPFEVIKEGFAKARANRAEFISIASNSEQVNYSLYRLAKDGQYIQIVRKEEKDHLPLITASLEEFEECLQIPKEEEIDEIANTIITEKLIQSLEVPRDKQVLIHWLGYTIKEALEIHSKRVIGPVLN
ncbi:MAG: hypothetical protein ACHQUC_06470, partial [Chlamydiales bacterium]